MKCNSEGWKNYSIRVSRNLYLLPHIIRMFKMMDMRRVENVPPNGAKKEAYMFYFGM
jgi:hypothetical protein